MTGREKVLDALSDHGWHRIRDIAARTGLECEAAGWIVENLVASGAVRKAWVGQEYEYQVHPFPRTRA